MLSSNSCICLRCIILVGNCLGWVIERDKASQLCTNTVFFQRFAVEEGLNCKIVEDSDVLWENIHYKVVHALILPFHVLRMRIVLLTLPIEDNIVVFKLKVEFKNEPFILSSNNCLIFIKGFRLCMIAFGKITAETLTN